MVVELKIISVGVRRKAVLPYTIAMTSAAYRTNKYVVEGPKPVARRIELSQTRI